MRETPHSGRERPEKAEGLRRDTRGKWNKDARGATRPCRRRIRLTGNHGIVGGKQRSTAGELRVFSSTTLAIIALIPTGHCCVRLHRALASAGSRTSVNYEPDFVVVHFGLRRYCGGTGLASRPDRLGARPAYSGRHRAGLRRAHLDFASPKI